MSATEQPPLQALSDAVEDWLRASDSFYGELHERLLEAQQQLSSLDGATVEVSQDAALTAGLELEIQRLRQEQESLRASNESLQAELAVLQENAQDFEQLHNRVLSLEEELGRERRRVRELQQVMEQTGTARGPDAEDSADNSFRVPEIRAFDAKGHKKRIGAILVDEGIVTPQQLQALLSEQSGAPHVRLGSLAIERGYTSDALVAKVLASQLRLPYVDLHHVQIEAKVLELLSSHLARLHRSLPLRQEQNRLILAMSNPLDLIAIEDIELATRLRVDPVVASAPAMETALEKFYPQAG